MIGAAEGLLSRVVARVVAWRWTIVVLYALFLPPSVYFASQVEQDNSIDRLIVATDPDYLATREFQQVFGGGEYALLLAEADDPFAPAVLDRIDRIEQALRGIPRVEPNSALSAFRRTTARFEATPEQARAFRAFATGTDLLRRQGLVGDHSLAIGILLEVRGTEERRATLEAIDRALAELDTGPTPLRALHRLGQPFVNAYLDETQRTTPRYFVLFAVFVVGLNLVLYRSVRTLLAFLITLGVCLAASVGYIGLTGGAFTIVSPMVPMTILVTATATLVYLHSRFVDIDRGRAVDEHQIFALANKFLACTASIFATAVGFAALAVSDIRPIRELGLWVAAGLLLTWITVFTLFPALQKVLRTPTSKERRMAAQWFNHIVGWLPPWSYRWRWWLVPTSLLLCAVGAISLFGIPGHLRSMQLETKAVEYINHRTELYKNTKRLEREITGLSMTEVWLRGKPGTVSDGPVLRGLNHLQQALERAPGIGAAVGMPNILRTLRYVNGQGDQLPEDEEGLDQVSASLETLAGKEPLIGRFVDKQMSQTHLAVMTSTSDYDGFVRLEQQIRDTWKQTVARDPALAPFDLEVVGLAPLEAKIAKLLVPTLTESFGLTVIIIFGTFLLVFRSGAARRRHACRRGNAPRGRSARAPG